MIFEYVICQIIHILSFKSIDKQTNNLSRVTVLRKVVHSSLTRIIRLDSVPCCAKSYFLKILHMDFVDIIQSQYENIERDIY